MIDSHAHVTASQFEADRSDILPRAQASGVTGWIEIGTTVAESRGAITLAEQFDTVWATVGVHPDAIDSLTESTWSELIELSQHRKVVAIGEVGLDYYRGGTLAEQQPVLEKFIQLAVTQSKPVVFHVRSGEQDAHADLLKLLTALPIRERPTGVIHTFSGTFEQAQAYLELGLYLSISGVITFKNAGSLVDVVKQTPLDRLVIETDCPYLAPEPHRGQRNEPAYVALVAQKIADIQKIPVAEVAQQTEVNTRALFKLT